MSNNYPYILEPIPTTENYNIFASRDSEPIGQFIKSKWSDVYLYKCAPEMVWSVFGLRALTQQLEKLNSATVSQNPTNSDIPNGIP